MAPFLLRLSVPDLSTPGAGALVSPRMPLVRTNSLAWSLTSLGILTLLLFAVRKSDCVVVLRRPLCFCAAFTYTGPIADGFSCFRGPAAMLGSGAASAKVSYLLCTDGTGLPRLIMDAFLLLLA